MKKAVYLFLINLMLTLPAFGDHLFGGDISFNCLGNNQYHISVIFYSDCFAILPPATLVLNVANNCGAIPSTYTLIQTAAGSVPLSTNCPSNVCDGGGINPGVYKTEFDTIITLTSACANWHVSVDEGTRTSYVNIFDQSTSHQLYLFTIINNTIPCEDSPVLSEPNWMACLDTLNCFTAGLNSTNDSTTWEFIAPRQDSNVFVPYNTGYSVLYPMDLSTPLMIDSTGKFCFNTSTQLWTNYTILGSNYRNGILTGQSMRDMSMLLVDCTTNPDLTGINGNTNTDTVACANTMMCYNIFSTGIVSTDSTFLSWDSGVPGNLTVYSGLNESATFCWTPQLSDTGHKCFTAFASQIGCPGNRTNQKTFCIDVLDSAACAIFMNQQEIDALDEITLYPQPATDYLKLNFKNNHTDISIKIFDVNGRFIMSINNFGNVSPEIHVGNLIPGVYQLQILNHGNILVKNIKFVKAD
jgi:hypothetical protein